VDTFGQRGGLRRGLAGERVLAAGREHHGPHSHRLDRLSDQAGALANRQRLGEGRLRLDDYVTSQIGLDDINTGLARLRQGQDICAVVLM